MYVTFFVYLCILSLVLAQDPLRPYPSPIVTPEHWIKLAHDDIDSADKMFSKPLLKKAKNAILFLGDGMGVTTVTAGRILKGQLNNKSGEETELVFDLFPHMSMVKTYNTNRQTPDSAATATAFLCGVKAQYGTMGFNHNVVIKTCKAEDAANNKVKSFLRLAKDAGKSVGIVTTTTITHATPGTAYCHSSYRYWEFDSQRNQDVPDVNQRVNCPDIAQQFVDNAYDFDVVFGGGRIYFLPKNESTINPQTNKTLNGVREDGVNLISVWKAKNKATGRVCKYIESFSDFDPKNTEDCVLGLFATGHFKYHFENLKPNLNFVEPSLAEMTTKAIQILSKNLKGYALLVEGGRIDHGHHGNSAKKALFDFVAFEEAVQNASVITKEDETLIVVTADHSHVFTLGHYGVRGNPILGKLLRLTSQGTYDTVKGSDGKPMTPIHYADGTSGSLTERANITNIDTTSDDYKQQALVPTSSESHGGEDIPVYARGPGAYLFHRTHEQSYVGQVVMRSLCVGKYSEDTHCKDSSKFGISLNNDNYFFSKTLYLISVSFFYQCIRNIY